MRALPQRRGRVAASIAAVAASLLFASTLRAGGPDVTVTSLTLDAPGPEAYALGPTAAETATFTLQLSGAVTGVSAEDFEVFDSSFTPVGPGGPQVTGVSGSGATYTVTVSRNGNAGAHRLSIAAGNDIVAVGGGAFNPAVGAPPLVVFTGTRPYLAQWLEIDPETGEPIVPPAFPDWGNLAYFRLVFSEPVTGFDAADIDFPFWSAGPPDPNVTVTGSGTTYDVLVDANGGTGFANIRVSPGATVAATDNAAALVNDPFGIVGPQLELSGGPPVASLGLILSPRNAMPNEIFFHYDEPVQNVTAGLVTVERADGAGGWINVPFTGTLGEITDKDFVVTGISYTAGTPDGEYRVMLAVGPVEDVDGNPPAEGDTATFTLDTLAPTVLSVTTATVGPVAPGEVEYLFTFSEPVTDFGPFDVAESVTGTATANATNSFDVPGRPDQKRVIVEVDGTGTVTIGAIAGGATDAAGNPNTAGASSMPLSVTDVRPTLTTFSTGLPNPAPATSTVTYTMQWSEPVTGFAAGDITITPTDLTFTGAVFTDTAGGVAGRDYTFTVSGVAAGNNGLLLLNIPADAVTNGVGLGNTIQGKSQNIDGVAPTGTITTAEASPTFDNILDWTMAFSEPVELTIVSGQPSSPDVTVDLTGGAAFAGVSLVHQNPATPDGRNFRFTAGGVTGDGTLRPRIPAGGIADFAGNVTAAEILGTTIQHLSTGITVGNVTVDASGATITIVGPGDYDIGAGAKIGKLLCNAPIQIRGTTITGNGGLSLVGSGGVAVYSGAFTVNGTTETLTPAAPQANVLAWATVPIGVCSISLDGGVFVNGWFDVADFAGNSFDAMQLDFNPAVFAPRLESFRLGDASCGPTASRLYPASFGSVGSEIRISDIFGFPDGSSEQFRLTPSGITGEGYFNIFGSSFALEYVDVTTTATGFEFTSLHEPIEDVFVSFDTLEFRNSGGLTYSTSGTITNAAGNLDATFFTSFTADALVTLDNVTIHTATPFGDVPVETAYLISTGASQSLFFDAASSKATLAGIPFTVEGAPSFDGTDGYTAPTIKLFDINAASISYDSLTVNTDEVSLGGGGLTLLGLAFNASATTAEGGGLEVTGGFELPSNLGALSSISLEATFTIEPGPRINLNGLSFCTPAADAIKIKNSNWNLPQLCFEYQQTPPEISADLTLGVPEVVDVAAGGSVRYGKVDRITVGVDGINKPIGATGAFLQSVEAEVRNLSRTENEWNETYYVFNPGMAPTEVTQTLSGIPPVQVRGTVGATAGPEIGPFSLIEAEVGAKIDETQMRLDGTMTLVIVNVGGGYFHARWSGMNPGVAFGGYMTYLLVIRGEINAALDVFGNFAGCAAITIQIPEGLPFEGTQFGGVSVCVTAPPFVIRGCVSILEAQVCVTVDEDGDVSLDSLRDRARYREEWDTPFFEPIALHSDGAAGGKEGTLHLSLFTDHRLGEKAYRGELPATAGLRGATLVPVTVTAGKGRVIRLTYENQGADPSFNLIAPDLSTYTSSMTLDAIDPDTAPATYFTGDARREAGYILRDAQAGTYTLEILNAAELGNYSVEVLVPSSVPRFGFTDVAVAGSTLNFEWTDEDPDSNATIALGLDTDRDGANGTQVLRGISEDDAANMASLDLATEPVQPGFYWPYAIVEDGDGAPVVAYAELPIFLPDVDASAPITDFQVSGVDGTASVSFTPVSDPDIVSYKLSWTDDQGDWDLNNATAIPAGESSALVSGFENNQPYKFVLAATSLVESSTLLRAQRFALLEAAAAEPGEAAARAAIRRADRSLDDATVAALASQAAEVARANAPWAAGRSDAFRAFVAEKAAAARSANRTAGVTKRYVDSHFAVADNVVFRQRAGTNNAPEFTSDPPAWVRRGDAYAHQLAATDPESEAVTFALESGPAGLAVSPAGAVAWDTTGAPLGDVTVRVRATDASGASATREWTIGVMTLVEPAGFAFVSRPDGNAGLGSTWTYQPVLGGMSADSDPDFSILLGGGGGITIDPDTGAMSWDTTGIALPPQGLASYRIVIKATEGGTRNRTAIQEFTLNVESRLDQLGDVRLSVPGDQFRIE